MKYFLTFLPSFTAIYDTLEPYERHREAWNLLETPQKQERDFVFKYRRAPLQKRGDQKPCWSVCYLSKNAIHKDSMEMTIPPEGTPIAFQAYIHSPKRKGNQEIPDKNTEEAIERIKEKIKGIDLQTLALTPLPKEQLRKEKSKSGSRINPYLMEGTGTISDIREFHKIVTCGIGRGKSLGYGLLSFKTR